MPSKVLVVFAHPALERSRVNRHLFDAVRSLPGVTPHDLYEVYPRFTLDVDAEQALCAEHDVIVFQHPFYWYSAPSLVKEWQDLVLELGWAYGPGGNALRGKVTLNVVTTGGTAAAYHPEGRNRFTMRQLLSPFDQTAHLCGMKFLAPLVVHGALALSGKDKIEPYAARYVKAIEALRDGTMDLDAAAKADELSQVLDAPARPSDSSATESRP